jgi:signal transduction histidine kinase
MRAYITRKVFITLAAICALLILSSPTEAQRRRAPRQRGYAKAQVNEIIKRVEERSDRFVKLFDRSLDRSRLDGTNREDRLNEHARNLETALDELRREFDRKENYVETRPEVRRCLDIATNINVAVRNRRLGGETERQWALLRSELNTLADVYGLPLIGSSRY